MVRMRGILVVALVAAGVLAPATASASHKKHVRHVRLAMVPLQTAQLGPAGAALPIQFDSGAVSNNDLPPPLRKAGRVSGYALDYGDAFTGGAGVTAIETQVEQFRTPTGARKALKFWKANEKLGAAIYQQVGITVSAHFFKVRAVGSG